MQVSVAFDDALRSLHLLLKVLFGLGMAFKSPAGETSILVQAKTGRLAFIDRQLKRITRLLRLFVIEVISPVDASLGLLLRAVGFSTPHPNSVQQALEAE